LYALKKGLDITMRKSILILAVTFILPMACMAQWSTVCGSGDGMVVNLARYNGDVYACGFFTEICSTNARYIARWDGSNWNPLDTGLSDAGHNIEVIDSELYVAQYKRSIDSNWVLKWDGSHFIRIGEGVYLTNPNVATSKTANLYDVAKFNGNIIASGEFDVVGNKPISGIMQWTGSQWDSLGSGLSGSIDGSGIMYPHQLLVYNSNLYVVGNFLKAGGITVNGVARWDGTQWHAMGAGFNSDVYAVGIINNEIYAGGEFTQSGATILQGIARWDGSQWVNPGFGIYYSIPFVHAYVHTIKQVGARGIFEGGFNRLATATDTLITNNVFASDGNNIDTMEGGVLNANFEGLIAHDSLVMVGGAVFATAAPDTTLVAEYHFRYALRVSNMTKGKTAIYPNPSTGILNIDNETAATSLSICNITGETIATYELKKGHNSVSIDAIATGVYLLMLQNDDGRIEYSRLIKE